MIKNFIFSTIILAFSLYASGQELTSILDKHLQAHQQNYWDAIQTVSSNGNWQGTFGDHLANFYLKRPNKFLMVNQSERFIQAYDGKTAWTIAKWTKKEVVDLSPEQALMVNQIFVFGSPLHKKRELSYEGKVSVDNQECYWIKEQQEFLEIDHFLTLENNLLYKSTIKFDDGKDQYEVSKTIRKYRKLQGLIFPTVIEMKSKDFYSEYTFESIVVGDIIDNKRFQRPNK